MCIVQPLLVIHPVEHNALCSTEDPFVNINAMLIPINTKHKLDSRLFDSQLFGLAMGTYYSVQWSNAMVHKTEVLQKVLADLFFPGVTFILLLTYKFEG